MPQLKIPRMFYYWFELRVYRTVKSIQSTSQKFVNFESIMHKFLILQLYRNTLKQRHTSYLAMIRVPAYDNTFNFITFLYVSSNFQL